MKHLLKIHRQRSNLRQLSKRADDFKFSLKTLLTRKNALINRFISTLIQEVRYTYRDLNEHIEQWLQEALLPLMQDNNYQKQLLEQHMMRLTQMQSQRNGHLDQIEELQTNIYQLNTALTALEPLYQETINAPLDEPLESTNLFPSSAQVVSLSEKRKQLGSK
jgi:hypothetical protein